MDNSMEKKFVSFLALWSKTQYPSNKCDTQIHNLLLFRIAFAKYPLNNILKTLSLNPKKKPKKLSKP